MNTPAPHQHQIAMRDVAGAAWLDSGVTLGLVVVDANRPAPHAAYRPAGLAAVARAAGGLLKQSLTAH